MADPAVAVIVAASFVAAASVAAAVAAAVARVPNPFSQTFDPLCCQTRLQFPWQRLCMQKQTRARVKELKLCDHTKIRRSTYRCMRILLAQDFLERNERRSVCVLSELNADQFVI